MKWVLILIVISSNGMFSENSLTTVKQLGVFENQTDCRNSIKDFKYFPSSSTGLSCVQKEEKDIQLSKD